jgi:S1-C subfamily serine protease
MVNMLDLLIVLLLIVQAKRWAEYGFVRGFMSMVAFWVGVLASVLIVPSVVRSFGDPFMRLSLSVLIIVLIASTMGLIGKIIGGKLHLVLHKIKLGQLNKFAGMAFSVVSTLFIVWLLASIFSSAPFISLNRQIRGSAILQALDNRLPPAPTVLSRLSDAISVSGFPKVFIGPEPSSIEPTDPPSSVDLQLALRAAGKSTVRIESYGCGGIKFGSGFVAAPDIVITNAHVVSGVDEPYITDANGQHRSEVILFDPELDIAVLRTSNLAGAPLKLAEFDYPRGTKAVALGYPGGKNLKAVPASVTQNVFAQGRNIYGYSVVNRPVSILQTSVISGNSGGPVVLSDGTVIGVIFARSESLRNVGFAIRSSEVVPLLDQALQRNQPVSTQSCSE